jgi:hypothetical protein
MNIKELLETKPFAIHTEIEECPALTKYENLDELRWNRAGSQIITQSGRFEIHEFYHVKEDYRRYWSLAGIKFDGDFVAITQSAGREGQDHCRVYIIDQVKYDVLRLFLKMVLILVEHQADDRTEPPKVSLDDSADDLFKFYGHDVRHDRYF